jgi:hypothetical protein
VANPKNGHKTGGEGSISLQYASTQGQQRLQNGRPQDKAKLCFGMLGEKTHENTLWNPCEVKLRVRQGTLLGSMEVWGEKWPHRKDPYDAVFWDLFFGCQLGHLGSMSVRVYVGLSWTMRWLCWAYAGPFGGYSHHKDPSRTNRELASRWLWATAGQKESIERRSGLWSSGLRLVRGWDLMAPHARSFCKGTLRSNGCERIQSSNKG